jgi:hypothetical protein
VDELFLSATARSFIAGLLRHAREITAVTNQWVNSYKRLFGYSAPGQIVEAPTYLCWGHANRSALVRVPMYKPGKANSTRVEVRSLDSACNPYLAFAVLLAAGLKGVEEGYELPPGAEDDVWSLSDTERRALGYDELPQNLADALTAMESSELVAETLGEHVFDFFCATSGPSGSITVPRWRRSSFGATCRPSSRRAVDAAPPSASAGRLMPWPKAPRRPSHRAGAGRTWRQLATDVLAASSLGRTSVVRSF